MPLDPNIALQVGQPIKPIDPMAAYGQVLTLKHLIDQSRTQGLQEEAMRAKMGRDAEDQRFQTSLSETKLLSKHAAAFDQIPVDQRASVWPEWRQRMEAQGIRNLPQDLPAPHVVSAMAALEADPNKLMEVAREAAQRKAYFEAQERARAATMGGAAPAAAPTQDGQPITSADIVAPKTTTIGQRSFSMDPTYHTRLADFVNQDPRLSGTKFANDALDMGLKIEKDTRDAEASGMQLVKGEDGRMYAFKNGRLFDGPVSTGRDPNANFWTGEDGNPVPNTAAQNYGVTKAKAGATNVSMQNNPIPLGKAAETKVDEGLLDTSASMMRVERIGSDYRPEWNTYLKQGEMAFSALTEKFGRTLPPAKRQELAAYTNWRSNALDNMNRTIKELTGSAMGVEEAGRIMSTLPTPDDSPTQFDAKLNDAKQKTKIALARLTYVKQNKGLSIEDIPLDRMPDIMRRRDSEIEGEVRRKFKEMNDKEVNELVKKQLAREFGLIYK